MMAWTGMARPNSMVTNATPTAREVRRTIRNAAASESVTVSRMQAAVSTTLLSR